MTRPDPLAFEYRPFTPPSLGHEGTDSATCTQGGCTLDSVWRYLLGDSSEHIARLNLCDAHARVIDGMVGRINCTACGKPMKVEIREKM